MVGIPQPSFPFEYGPPKFQWINVSAIDINYNTDKMQKASVWLMRLLVWKAFHFDLALQSLNEFVVNVSKPHLINQWCSCTCMWKRCRDGSMYSLTFCMLMLPFLSCVHVSCHWHPYTLFECSLALPSLHLITFLEMFFILVPNVTA